MRTKYFKLLSALVMVATLLAVVAPQVALAEEPKTSAERAVEAAKQYAGITLNYVREAGLQAQDPLFMGPKWEELTGIKINVVEMSYLDMYTNQLQDHLTGGGSYDVLDVSPLWMIDYVNSGVLEPLDSYIEKYMNPEDLQDYLPVYASEGVMKINGVTYGLFDDGDVFILYYRKDLFEDATNQSEFKAKYGYDLVPPETEQQMYDAAEFFTTKYAPDLYGLAMQRLEGQAYSWFIGPFSARGGQFFDENMKATINSEIGVALLTDMVKQNKVMPPGVEKWGFMEVLSAWMDGKVAMIITWPPIGRWGAGYGDTAKQMNWVPASTVKGKVGYMPQPGGRPTLAGGFNMAVSADSANKEAAYLFVQWMTSPDISLERVLLRQELLLPVQHRGVGRQAVGQPAKELRRVHVAGAQRHLLAVRAEDEKGGHGRDVMLARGRWIGVHVHHGAGELVQLFQHGGVLKGGARHLLARTAPGGGEVEQHRLLLPAGGLEGVEQVGAPAGGRGGLDGSREGQESEDGKQNGFHGGLAGACAVGGGSLPWRMGGQNWSQSNGRLNSP